MSKDKADSNLDSVTGKELQEYYFEFKEMERLQKKYNLLFVNPRTVLVSYPKSGRTWLRMMLAKLMQLALGEKAKSDKYEIFPALHDTYKELKERFKDSMQNRNPRIYGSSTPPRKKKKDRWKEQEIEKKEELKRKGC